MNKKISKSVTYGLVVLAVLIVAASAAVLMSFHSDTQEITATEALTFTSEVSPAVVVAGYNTTYNISIVNNNGAVVPAEVNTSGQDLEGIAVTYYLEDVAQTDTNLDGNVNIQFGAGMNNVTVKTELDILLESGNYSITHTFSPE